jgi:hypothetical protein
MKLPWQHDFNSKAFLDKDHLIQLEVSGKIYFGEFNEPIISNLSVTNYYSYYFQENHYTIDRIVNSIVNDNENEKNYDKPIFETLEEAWDFAENKHTFLQEFAEKQTEEAIKEGEYFRTKEGILWCSYYSSYDEDGEPWGLYCPTTEEHKRKPWNKEGKEMTIKEFFMKEIENVS